MKCLWKLIGGLILFLILTGIWFNPESVRASEPLTIGILHSQSFPYATMMKNSFEMALDVINKEGGINGRPLKLAFADDQSDPRVGEQKVEELVTKTGAIMLIGGYQSANTMSMARVADKLDKPLLVCTAADDMITQMKWSNVYRLNPPASEYAKGLEDFLKTKIEPKSMSVIYENSPYGTGAAMRMMLFCRENGIDVLGIEPYKKEKLTAEHAQRILAPLKQEPPDVIYMVSYLDDAAMLVKQIRMLKINSLLCGSAGGFTHQDFIALSFLNTYLNIAGDFANNVLTASLWSPQLKYPGAKEYYDEYINKFSVPPDYHGAEAYSALLVAVDALRRAKSYEAESIRAALDSTDMMTPFGPVKFCSYGKFERQNRLPTQVLEIINRRFECIWPKEFATARFVPPPNWRGFDY